MLSLFELLAGLLTVTATFAWLNHQVLRLPDNIGLLVMGLGASLLLIAIEIVFPDTPLYATLAESFQQIDFYEAVMHGMLAFLLFAGALHVDFGRLRRRALVVGAFATLGVGLSTLIIATGLWLGTAALGVPVSFAWSLVFGALIAPTDPVAVLSTLRSVNVPVKLETDMSGEALFNDGIAVVLFTITLQMASGSEAASNLYHILRLLVLEAGGGALLGLATGYVAYRAMRAIDDYSIEVMISLALVTSTYALADAFHMSGPIAVVVAGVLIGNRGVAYAMSDRTKRYVFGFWTLIDDILNAVLFLLIGLEVLVLRFNPAMAWVGLLAVPLVLAGRFISVAISISLLARWQTFARGTLYVLTWGGVRGGISVALALSLTGTPARAPLLAATYAVVLFTILVQGLTLGWVVRKTALEEGKLSGEGPGERD
ncbi:sodium:proton antiporter [Aquabacter sp. L1I39]|uniref:cation:proton antiporter n=1 Tax=Aquabacter sp. L1I39 TaxID=2820278 RepID=UPI001AD9935B|nr:sodium:proton antiporter [Aquabacter sp. L1I39]QTL04731.1 sodium:proton antiporter [Aquabacter sp. L1I39]